MAINMDVFLSKDHFVRNYLGTNPGHSLVGMVFSLILNTSFRNHNFGPSRNVAYNCILHRVLHVVARVRSKKATPKSTEGFREMPHNLFEGFHILPSVLATTNRLKLRSSLIRLFIIWDISCRSKGLRCSICTSLGVLCFLKWSFVDTLIN